MEAPGVLRCASSSSLRHSAFAGRESSCSSHRFFTLGAMRARPMAFCTASPKDRAPRVFTICTLTVCACGTYSNGSEDVVTTSNVVSMDCMV